MADPPSAQAGGDPPAPLALVVDAALPTGVRDVCRDLARALAAQTGRPVALLTVPAGPARGVAAALEPLVRAAAAELVAPPPPAAPMRAAPFVWRDDGRPDWGAMWTTYCELALYGGPPHRGPESPLREAGPASAAWPPPDLLAELRRGIWETTGLYAEPGRRGWLAVTCDSSRMAAWLCAAIILENVEARCEDERLLLPVSADYELGDHVKSLITVLAKTHHFWRMHLVGPTADGPGAA